MTREEIPRTPIFATHWVCDGVRYTLLSDAEAHAQRLMDYRGKRVTIWKELTFLKQKGQSHGS